MCVGHDDKGESPAWHLDLVEVTHISSGSVYYFPCRRWFDSTQDDRLIVRTLEVSDVLSCFCLMLHDTSIISALSSDAPTGFFCTWTFVVAVVVVHVLHLRSLLSCHLTCGSSVHH